jgi:predicted NUDIX family phosphoesterase
MGEDNLITDAGKKFLLGRLQIEPKVFDEIAKSIPKIPELQSVLRPPNIPLSSTLKHWAGKDNNKSISMYVDGEVIDYTLDEAVTELYKHPIGSADFKALRGEITGCLKEPKYDEYIIAFKSKMHEANKDRGNDTKQLGLNDMAGIVPAPESYNYHQDVSVFRDDITFLEDDRFIMKKRRELEYNPEYKQLVVSAYITDGRHIILLRTGNNGQTRIQGKYTFVQGHVDFNPNAYIMSQKEFLLDGLIREFHEEIKTDYKIDLNVEPKYYINDRGNHIGLEHFGVIYEIRVKDAQELFAQLTSGEEMKHKVEILDRSKYSEYKEDLDNWVQMVFEKLAIFQ